MPTLNKRQGKCKGDQSPWFIVTPGRSHPYTFQLDKEGYEWLIDSGLGHEDDVDWDVFRSLRSLGLLYTLETDYEPHDAPVPDTVSFEGIDPERRLKILKQLLQKRSVEELARHSGTLEFLLSFGKTDEAYESGLLSYLLDETPFTDTVIADWDVAIDNYSSFPARREVEYNPVLLAVLFKVGYSDLESTDIDIVNEGSPIWMYDTWTVCAGSELQFYSINSTFAGNLPEPLVAEVVEQGNLTAHDELSYEFFEKEMSAISSFQVVNEIQDLNPYLGSIIGEGLRSGTRHQHVMIVKEEIVDYTGPIPTKDAVNPKHTPTRSLFGQNSS